VDVTGTHDLETEKLSLLENIQKVQEIWGGYLVWDSVAKTVSLRDESTWQNYTGFQVRYAKNLKSITRMTNYDLVTRLYPFGENDLGRRLALTPHLRPRLVKIKRELDMLVMETFAGTLRDTGVPAEEQARFASNYLATVARLGVDL